MGQARMGPRPRIFPSGYRRDARPRPGSAAGGREGGGSHFPLVRALHASQARWASGLAERVRGRPDEREVGARLGHTRKRGHRGVRAARRRLRASRDGPRGLRPDAPRPGAPPLGLGRLRGLEERTGRPYLARGGCARALRLRLGADCAEAPREPSIRIPSTVCRSSRADRSNRTLSCHLRTSSSAGVLRLGLFFAKRCPCFLSAAGFRVVLRS